MEQLFRIALRPARQRQRSDRAGVAPRPGMKVTVDHQTTADKGTDEQVQEVAHGCGPSPNTSSATQAAVVSLANSTGSCISAWMRVRMSISFHASITPAGAPRKSRQPPSHRGAATPAPTTRAACGPSCASTSASLSSMAGKDLLRIGIAVFEGFAAADLAHEVHRQHVQAAPPDLDAQRERAVRVERDRHGGLPDAAAQPLLLDYQAVFQQTVDDHRGGLRAQPRESGDVGLGQAVRAAGSPAARCARCTGACPPGSNPLCAGG